MAVKNYSIYVPAQFIEDAKGIALRYAGGYTLLPTMGGAWIDDSGKTHHDDIIILQVFTDSDTVQDEVTRLLHSKGELSVAYTVNSIPHLVPNPFID